MDLPPLTLALNQRDIPIGKTPALKPFLCRILERILYTFRPSPALDWVVWNEVRKALGVPQRYPLKDRESSGLDLVTSVTGFSAACD